MRCNKCPGRLESNCTFNILSTKEKKEQTKQNKTKQSNNDENDNNNVRLYDNNKNKNDNDNNNQNNIKRRNPTCQGGALFLVVTLFLVLVCPNLILLLKFC